MFGSLKKEEKKEKETGQAAQWEFQEDENEWANTHKTARQVVCACVCEKKTTTKTKNNKFFVVVFFLVLLIIIILMLYIKKNYIVYLFCLVLKHF